MSKPVIKLRVYKKLEGRNGLLKNELGKVENENWVTSLEYDSLEWHNYKKNLSPEIHAKVEVEGYFEKAEKGYEEKDCPQSIVLEIADVFKKPAKELSPQEREIAELRAMIAELKAGNSKPKKEVEKVETNEDDSDLENARARYKEAFNKKPHHSWNAEQIEQKIKELSE